MKASEKLLSLTNIQGCATAAEHFCSITKGGGDNNYYIREPFDGILQNIEIQNGLVNKINFIKGFINKENVFLGKINKINTIKGIIIKDKQIKGDTKCQ